MLLLMKVVISGGLVLMTTTMMLHGHNGGNGGSMACEYDVKKASGINICNLRDCIVLCPSSMVGH
jgi:hypothetical protein